MINFQITDGNHRDFVQLCSALDAFLNEISGGEQNRSCYLPFNRPEDLQEAIVAYDGHQPVGCAGIREYTKTIGELKRFFIREKYRGQGIADQLLAIVEHRAGIKGYRYLVLESGEPLVAAMHFYRRQGFQVIENYGPYQNLPDSICMKKSLPGHSR